MDPNQPIVPPTSQLPKFLSNSKSLLTVIGLLIILPVLVVAVESVQRIFPKAAEVLVPEKVLLSSNSYPFTSGMEIPLGSTLPAYFSAQAIDSNGNNITSSITYVWGISSTDSVGNLQPDPNLPIATFTPSKNIGLGNIWVRAYNSYGTAMTSLKVCVGLPCQSTPVAYDPYSLTDGQKELVLEIHS